MKELRNVIIIVVIIFLVVTAIFFAVGNQPKENVQEENTVVPTVTSVEVPTAEPTVEPTPKCVRISETLLECTYVERIHVVNSVDTVAPVSRERPTEAVGNFQWKLAKMPLSKENLGLWMGRNNPFWRVGAEEVYHRIAFYNRAPTDGVIVKSAIFDELIVSQDSKVYLMKNVFVGDDYRNEGIRAFASEFPSPNDQTKKVKMVFFYDQEGDIVAFGFGDAKGITTTKNYVVSGGDGGGSSSSSGAGTSDGGGSAGPSGDSGGPVGGVPS